MTAVVFALGVTAALLLGLGWVLQQKVAAAFTSSDLTAWRLLLALIRKPWWWIGIGSMTVGQTLSAWALQLAPVTLVEPLLLSCLLFAFFFAAVIARRAPRWQEVVGAVMLAGALAAFLAVGDPRADAHSDPGLTAILVAAGLSVAVAFAIVAPAKILGRHNRLIPKAVLFATAAGIMYGLQDATTRGAIVQAQRSSLIALMSTAWPYLVVGAATTGVLLSQTAFRAVRLNHSLPPTAAAQPIAGIVLGLALLGDQLTVHGAALAVEVVSLVAMLTAVFVIGRSPQLAMRSRDEWSRSTRDETQIELATNRSGAQQIG
jgi:drug/metabolite transporter (DMT)-like permease